jgi:acetyl-CoA carboxylase carboxyltransferase component
VTGEEPASPADQLRAARAVITTEMGGGPRIAKLHAQDRLTVRERIAAFADPGSFAEVGTFARSNYPPDRDTTPGDGKIGGHCRVDGRPVTVVGDDVTVKRGSTSKVGETKVTRLYEQALAAGNPFVYFGEAGGARIPEIMDVAYFVGLPAMPWMARRRRRIPTATVIVGDSFGASSLHSTFTDFVVQVQGSCLAVTSPRVIEVATGEQISFEALGGTDVHERSTGQIDLSAADESSAYRAVREFLGFLPSSIWSRPPRSESADPVGQSDDRLAATVPERRRRAYDMRTVLRRLADGGHILPFQPNFGRSLIAALGRIDGYPVGFLASQPMHQAGALTPDACDKATRLLCLCDAFDIPVVFLHDTPGFLVGWEVEHARLLHRASRMLQALSLCGSPRLTVILRKSFGMAFHALNGTGMGADSIYAWPGAEIGFMDPEVAANVVYASQLSGLAGADREREHAELATQIARSTSPYDAAGVMAVDEIIDPAMTRAVLARRLGELSGRRIRAERDRPLAGWSTC